MNVYQDEGVDLALSDIPVSVLFLHNNHYNNLGPGPTLQLTCGCNVLGLF